MGPTPVVAGARRPRGVDIRPLAGYRAHAPRRPRQNGPPVPVPRLAALAPHARRVHRRIRLHLDAERLAVYGSRPPVVGADATRRADRSPARPVPRRRGGALRPAMDARHAPLPRTWHARFRRAGLVTAPDPPRDQPVCPGHGVTGIAVATSRFEHCRRGGPRLVRQRHSVRAGRCAARHLHAPAQFAPAGIRRAPDPRRQGIDLGTRRCGHGPHSLDYGSQPASESLAV